MDPSMLGMQGGQQNDRTVYVGNVGRDVDEQTLHMLFVHCGQVMQIRIAGDPSYDSRFAFIEFMTPEQAQTAILLDGMTVFDRNIKVSMARGTGAAGPGVVKSGDPDRVTRTIHVGGIPMDIVSEEQLADYFKHVGEVIAVRKSGRFAWIEFESVKAANQALGLDGESLGNSTLRISQSKTPIHTAGWRKSGSGPKLAGDGAPPRMPPPMAPPPMQYGAPPPFGAPPPPYGAAAAAPLPQYGYMPGPPPQPAGPAGWGQAPHPGMPQSGAYGYAPPMGTPPPVGAPPQMQYGGPSPQHYSGPPPTNSGYPHGRSPY